MAKLYIQKDDQQEISIDEVVPGLRFLKLTHKAGPIVSNWTTVNGRDGERQHGAYTYGPSTTTADFFFKASDYPDFRLAVDKLSNLFRSRTPLRIRDSVQPGIVQYGVVQEYDMAALNFIDSQFSVPFAITGGMRQSLLRSDDDWNKGIELGMELPTNPVPQYVFASGSFSVYNPSDIDIDPFEQNHDLNVTAYVDGSPTITNKTTGRSFTYERGLNASQKLELRGVDAFVDGNPAGINTDWGDLNLKAKTWNEITVTGCTVKSITFSFPFLFF
ncbi:MAG: phage tail family protein [Furfurilactobacillus sp.]|jgi:hypothetical protein|uniref:phage tail domain-containing protein n=1 Tax=Furfurilactobacillus sp. TaxID=2767911 RepID=UPI002589D4EF|nr:phage tail domain-containing protein [Furfurilactobacillus sp.]MCH4010600.1 phage tail family protein [Furfurilactobacillus sp.]MCH4036492.1 phage tail family protein [Furfurilactobacillus sp.]MCH4114562.1 phage tail family protein [Furfurilactobacillus sp.]MCH4133819.1 phage tail family protein [Furfurilactobacillus sp.]MCI1340144.1 phage tail family protein [Furfurilactobacillus sp.]